MEDSTVECPHCRKSFKRKGITSHKISCAEKKEAAEDEARFVANKRARRQEPIPAPAFPTPWEADVGSSTVPLPMDVDLQDLFPPITTFAADETFTDPGGNVDNRAYSDGDIRVDYHPSSGREPEVFAFEEFTRGAQENRKTYPVDPEPWAPFKTREDFEFAELARDTGMTKTQVNTLIDLVRRCINGGKDSFTLSNFNEMHNTLQVASERLPKFEKKPVSATYKKESLEYDVWVRPIWTWIEDMLQNPDLIHHFVWDACRMSKFDEQAGSWVRFYDEPWTADRFWETQSGLPPEAKPLVLCIYADKSKLSSFGTKQGYPVIARCANLPVEIRNGNGLAGGRVVGWLPVMEEDAAESGKSNYVNLKRVVWHKSFYELLGSIRELSKVGYCIECADEVTRRIFPAILILSADYEEQCMMALVRGVKCNFPCPVCLVPNEELSKGEVYALRTTKTMKEIYHKAKEMLVKDRDDLLKDYGLRNVENAFWGLRNSDPYQALSFDRLHASHLGLFKDHIWETLKEKVKLAGRPSIKKVDNQVAMFPRWSGLIHFTSIMAMGFTDGSKYENFSKISTFVLCNLFEEKTTGYLLLKVLRCYIEIDMYASFHVHTDQTIAAGRQQVARFYPLLKTYMDLEVSKNKNLELPLKNWNFPKIHSQLHLFDDIIAKGVTRNYNSKTNESFHGPFRWNYVTGTNFRDVDEQLLNLDHMGYIISLIRSKIDILDKAKKSKDIDSITGPLSPIPKAANGSFSHVYLGSAKDKTTVEEFATKNGLVYPTFRRLLEDFLNQFYEANQLHREKYLRVQGDQKIVEFQYLQVNYESMVDWRVSTDRLRCNESFFGHERRDHVLIQSGHRNFFACLLHLFQVTLGTQTHALAYVKSYSRPPGSLRRKDKDLGLYRLRLNPNRYEIVSLESVIRGALLVPDSDNAEDHFVVDTVDADMFLRMKGLNF